MREVPPKPAAASLFVLAGRRPRGRHRIPPDGTGVRHGTPFDATVDTPQARGVEFRVCNNTPVRQMNGPKKVVAQAGIVPTGAARIGRLHANEGRVHLKP